MIYKQVVNVFIALVVCLYSFSLANAQNVRKGGEKFDLFLSYRINGEIWQKSCLGPRASPMPKTFNMNVFSAEKDLTPRVYRTSYNVSDTQFGSVRLGQVIYGSRCYTPFGICFLVYPAPVGAACNCGPYWGHVIV